MPTLGNASGPGRSRNPHPVPDVPGPRWRLSTHGNTGQTAQRETGTPRTSGPLRAASRAPISLTAGFERTGQQGEESSRTPLTEEGNEFQT